MSSSLSQEDAVYQQHASVRIRARTQIRHTAVISKVDDINNLPASHGLQPALTAWTTKFRDIPAFIYDEYGPLHNAVMLFLEPILALIRDNRAAELFKDCAASRTYDSLQERYKIETLNESLPNPIQSRLAQLEGLVKETEERFPHDTEAIAAWIGALTPLLKHGLQERHGWDMIEDFFKELLNQGGFNDLLTRDRSIWSYYDPARVCARLGLDPNPGRNAAGRRSRLSISRLAGALRPGRSARSLSHADRRIGIRQATMRGITGAPASHGGIYLP